MERMPRGVDIKLHPTALLSARVVIDVVMEAANDCNRPAWMSFGACVDEDPDMFFPERGADPGPAKAICRGCDVREACLVYALDNDEQFGIYGGLTARERRRLKRQRMYEMILARDQN